MIAGIICSFFENGRSRKFFILFQKVLNLNLSLNINYH